VSCPGPTATEFAQVAGDEKTALFKSGVMSAHAVAEDAYRAMMQGKVLSIPGFMNKLKAASLPFAPRRMKRNLAAKLNKAT
jgi:short-subunit dehydrogenase